MAKERIVNTRFWRDHYIQTLTPNERLVFLWAITNPATELCGAYESAIDTIAAETGIRRNQLHPIFEKFAADGKMIYREGWVIVRNFAKHQHATSTNIRKGVVRSLNDCPDWVKDTVSNGFKEYRRDTTPKPELCETTYRDNPVGQLEPEPSVKPLSAVADADRVFEYWKKTLNHPTAKFTKEREVKVKSRLKTYSVEDIFRAIDGCKVSPHHQGQNERNTVYDDLELICRTDTQLEKFMSYAVSKSNGAKSGPVDEMAFQRMFDSGAVN